MTIQDFTDFVDACRGKTLADIRVNAGRLNADGIKGMALAFACNGSASAVSKAVYAYVKGQPFVLLRGTHVWQDGYPYIVTADTLIPSDDDSARSTQIPCTSIIAYGDPSEEQEYSLAIPYGELSR